MKLRIHDNSIRLRLTRSEVARFAAAGAIEGAIEFGPLPNQRLTYGLESSPQAAGLAVRLDERRVTIVLPETTAKAWTESDEVGIKGTQSLGEDKQLHILVEKEFRRMHGAKANPDLYPNPLESKSVQA